MASMLNLWCLVNKSGWPMRHEKAIQKETLTPLHQKWRHGGHVMLTKACWMIAELKRGCYIYVRSWQSLLIIDWSQSNNEMLVIVKNTHILRYYWNTASLPHSFQELRSWERCVLTWGCSHSEPGIVVEVHTPVQLGTGPAVSLKNLLYLNSQAFSSICTYIKTKYTSNAG